MPGPAWGEDSEADERTIAANVAELLKHLLTVAPARRAASVSQAHEWHRIIYRDVPSVPAANYLGTPRGSADPSLVDYEVVLRNSSTGEVVAHGVGAAHVERALDTFATSLTVAVTSLDTAIAPNRPPQTENELLAVVELAAVAHGEWVRIHPYANGNGRTARVWANWVAMRYGLPPFVRIKPRPDGLLYALAAQRSMGLAPDFAADHDLTLSVFLDLLRQRP